MPSMSSSGRSKTRFESALNVSGKCRKRRNAREIILGRSIEKKPRGDILRRNASKAAELRPLFLIGIFEFARRDLVRRVVFEIVKERIRIGEDLVHLVAGFRHELLLGHLVHERFERIVIPVQVIKGDGLRVPPELLQGDDLEELLQRADAARHDDEGVAVVLHRRLALCHRLGKGELIALAEDAFEALFAEEVGDDAVDIPPAALGAARRSAHEPRTARAKDERMPAARHLFREALHLIDITLVDGGARRPENTDLHKIPAPYP